MLDPMPLCCHPLAQADGTKQHADVPLILVAHTAVVTGKGGAIGADAIYSVGQ